MDAFSESGCSVSRVKGRSGTSSRLTRPEQAHLLPRSAFPVLEAYEEGDAASLSRRDSCARATHELEVAFEEALERLCAPLLHDLRQWADGTTRLTQLPIPAFERGEDLRAAAVLGPSLHGSLSRRLQAGLKSRGTAYITLGPEDYDALVKAFKVIIRKVRAAARHSEGDDEHHNTGTSARRDEGLEALCDVKGANDTKIEHIIISLTSLPSHPLGVLQDLLYALQSFASSDRAPRVSLILWLPTGVPFASGSGMDPIVVLDDALPIPPSVRGLLDLETFSLPGVTQAWEALTESLWLRPSSQPSLWLGPRTWSDVEQRLLENDASLEIILAALRIVVYHHFSTNPLSALAHADLMPSAEHFKPALLNRARLSITELYDFERRVPPLPPALSEDEEELTPAAHLVALLKDDDHLLRTIGSLRRIFEADVRERIVALRALCIIDERLGVFAVNSGTRPNTRGIAALWSAALEDEGGAEEVKARLPTLREASMHDISKVLVAIREVVQRNEPLQSAEASLERFAKELAKHITKLGGDEMDAEDEQGSDQEMLTEEEREQRRLDAVQRRLKREEQLRGKKKALLDWLSRSLRNALSSLHDFPLVGIYIYDHSLQLENQLDAKPRASLLAALHDPRLLFDAKPTLDSDAYISDLAEDDEVEEEAALRTLVENGALPDTCRAYSLYSDAGKTLNVADWQEAFAQGVEAAASHKGRRTRAQEEEMQARFAASVNELTALGLLKRTGRQPEHVAKTTFDLPP